MKPLTNKEVAELKYNQKYPAESVRGKCLQCGKCCKKIKCEYYKDGCTIYENRPTMCRTFPQDKKGIDNFKCKGFRCLRS